MSVCFFNLDHIYGKGGEGRNGNLFNYIKLVNNEGGSGALVFGVLC